MQPKDLSRRVAQLIEQSEKVLATKKFNQYGEDHVDAGAMAGLRASTLSFISMTYGNSHSYYSEYDSATPRNLESSAKRSHAILHSIQNELDGGWIFTVKKLIAAEIFYDFLEMAEHLLEQGYKDPAAVMIGSVLEENLRQLCSANNIETELEKDGVLIPKKADRLNSDLAKSEVYTKLDQKSITAWLDLRNNAAHGKYNEYTKEQVNFMLNGITEFLARVNH
ncbi:hypothetical protein ACI51W_06355 [Pseudomonas marginalis]|uniref:hypothetical protein n=1 Tax=Pseudomonas TaxID=286 RepID=UPI000485E544|nr:MULTISPECIES: hypothetical protein [unclassified Pseudomonas]PUB43908.1 hypothetical protein C8K58_1063 [Pseudomonas sp. GV047]SMF11233.1 hypothetical protein SAMN05660912_01517 [Pseudomonas sp. LAMO17WK12:I1]